MCTLSQKKEQQIRLEDGHTMRTLDEPTWAGMKCRVNCNDSPSLLICKVRIQIHTKQPSRWISTHKLDCYALLFIRWINKLCMTHNWKCILASLISTEFQSTQVAIKTPYHAVRAIQRECWRWESATAVCGVARKRSRTNDVVGWKESTRQPKPVQ